MTNNETVLATYDSLETANNVVRELVAAGFPRSDIGLAANDASGDYGRYLDEDVKGDEGAGFGAVIGGLTGIVVGLSAILIPGIGPIIAAGPLAAVLGGATGAAVGAAAGALTGGITASLVHMGVPEEHASTYAEAVRRGHALVTATAKGDDVTDAMNIMRRHNPIDIERRATQWRKHGWQGFDPKADPYTAVDLAEERELYKGDATNTESAEVVRRYPPIPPVP